MSLSNISTAGLEKLVALAKKRDSLQAELAAVEQKLSVAFGGTSAPVSAGRKVRKTRRKGKKVKTISAPSEAAVLAVNSLSPVAKVANPAKKGKRGALKEAVLAELKAAGSKGTSVKDLSAKLGVKSANIHVWFSTTGKKVKGVKKTGAGTWAYAG